MALHSSRMTQDQNFSIQFDGGMKTIGSTVHKKKGGFGTRKVLNDISNSGKPSALQASRKHNVNNVIPIGEDFGVAKKAQASVGGKGKVSGRKALGDLTNGVKPFAQQQQQQKSVKKKIQGKQLITVAEDEDFSFSIAEEGFLHNHDECIKSRNKALDLDEFLKAVGLDSRDTCVQPPLTYNPKDENLYDLFEIEEITEPITEYRPRGGLSSPNFGSPNSPRMSYMNMDYDDFSSFILAETPLRLK
uniref:protein PATRONUS 2-like n=1 Tax=Erigeron canadensis TaxID=72917 RepID=UPI001CB95C34|nr:protein PATRONUS 2-like [Erigeron canadensis]